MDDNIGKKMINSTKWSTLGEVTAKLISPITNMILARLLLIYFFYHLDFIVFYKKTYFVCIRQSGIN